MWRSVFDDSDAQMINPAVAVTEEPGRKEGEKRASCAFEIGHVGFGDAPLSPK
jgi:hypothetical protein